MRKTLPLAPALFLFVVLVMAAPAFAAETASAAVTLADGRWTVGDPLELVLTVNHPAGTVVLPPDLESGWGDFVVVSQAPPMIVEQADGSRTTTQRMDARLFAPGPHEAPPLTIALADENGALSYVTTAPLPVTVESVLVPGDEALRDIKPQAELPVSGLWAVALGAFLLAVIVGGLFLLHRRRAAPVPVDNRLPHEVALAELERIAALALPGRGAYKEHYALISDVMRVYLERAYGVAALERTTAEIRAGLQLAVVTPSAARQFVAVLSACDMVKFADFVPDPAEADSILAQARSTVALSVSTAVPPEPPLSADPRGRALSVNGRIPTSEVQS